MVTPKVPLVPLRVVEVEGGKSIREGVVPVEPAVVKASN